MNNTKKAVVYTALVGEYDYLRTVPEGLEEIDFICFTDDSLLEKYCERKGWLFRKLPEEVDSSRKGCRQIKSLPQKYLNEYKVSIWVDSNISFKKNIGDFIDEFIHSESLIRAFHHPVRSCAYLEAEVCIEKGKDTKEKINTMVDRMRSSGFPENYGLTETNVLFRKHNDETVKKLNIDWNYLLTNFTIRDQISFDYLCWYHDVDVWFFVGSAHHNQHPVFSRGLHRSKNIFKDTFAYFESLQSVYPYVGSIINFLYSLRR